MVRSEPSCDAPNQSFCLPDLVVVHASVMLVPAHDKLVPAYDKLKPALPVMLPVPEMKSMHVPGRSPVVPRSGPANACDDEGIAQ